MTQSPPAPGVLAVLQRIRQPPAQGQPGERCEMCTQPVAEEHRHLVDLKDRSLICVCQACGLLFGTAGAAGGRYLTVPDRHRIIVDFQLSAAQWDRLQIPVGVAFFFRNSTLGDTSAFFPSPAGATECLLPLDTWAKVERDNPILGTLAADVEALLVRTETDRGPLQCFVVPIDVCYALVGLLRSRWRGFDGGAEVHQQLSAFFHDLADRAAPIGRGDVDG